MVLGDGSYNRGGVSGNGWCGDMVSYSRGGVVGDSWSSNNCRCGIGSGSNNRGSMGIVSGCGRGRRSGSRFVGGDSGTESSMISNIVDNTCTSINVTETIRTGLNSSSVSGFTTERSTSRVSFVVSEVVVSYTIFSAELVG